MRHALTIILFVSTVTLAAPPAKTTNPNYDTPTVLSKKATTALDNLKKRELVKAKAGFIECVTRADPSNQLSQSIAEQCAFFIVRLYDVEYTAIWKEHQSLPPDDPKIKELEAQLHRLSKEKEAWHNAHIVSPRNVGVLSHTWATIQRDWVIQDSTRSKP